MIYEGLTARLSLFFYNRRQSIDTTGGRLFAAVGPGDVDTYFATERVEIQAERQIVLVARAGCSFNPAVKNPFACMYPYRGTCGSTAVLSCMIRFPFLRCTDAKGHCCLFTPWTSRHQ